MALRWYYMKQMGLEDETDEELLQNIGGDLRKRKNDEGR
jgi:hypothetical protein